LKFRDSKFPWIEIDQIRNTHVYRKRVKYILVIFFILTNFLLFSQEITTFEKKLETLRKRNAKLAQFSCEIILFYKNNMINLQLQLLKIINKDNRVNKDYLNN